MPIDRSILTTSEESLAFSTKAIITAYLGDLGARIAEALVEQGKSLPPVLIENLAEGSRLSTPSEDKQISWGITQQDGRYRVAIILQTTLQNSAAARAAEYIERSYGGVIVRDISGRAHSSDPGDRRESFVKGVNPGASISHHSGFPGTIGATVRSVRPDNEWMGLLGAAHVLAHNNAPKGSRIE
jgi:hypothetical protein